MPPKRKSAPKRKAAAGAAASKKKARTDPSMDESEDEEVEMAAVVIKGNAAVDKSFPQAAAYHVYSDATGPWDFTGNQTNIKNNNNKFYIIQLLQHDKNGDFKTWTRWGRVGAPGQSAVLAAGKNLGACKAAFMKKFKDKTRNDWEDKDNFEPVKGKYDMVKIDYGADVEEEEAALAKAAKSKGAAGKKRASKLDPRVKSLMELIFDVKAMTAAVVEMKYDVKKMPLGKLTHEQITAGYDALKAIELVLQKKKKGDLNDLSSRFYTIIPHVFGMKRPQVLNTLGLVKEKAALLEALDDIKTALKVMDAAKGNDLDHEADKNFKSLKCGLEPVERGTDAFKMVERYMKNTHGSTHKQYTLELLDLFEADKDLPFTGASVGNTALLWHGSRLTNWVGILSQGLRIAPPEAPCTGYMFGKGVYFADMVTKSANYCFTNRANNTGVMLLCEVALGNQHKRFDADCYLHSHMPAGTHSTWGRGQNFPDPKQTVKVDGVSIPMGKPVHDASVKNPSGGFTLGYNEFICYDTAQIRFKYLLKLKFNYK